MMSWKCDCDSWILFDPSDSNPTVVRCTVCNRDWNLYPMMIPKTNCWKYGCNKNDIYRIGRGDGNYGHQCGICGESLRTHPFFGEGKEFDMGDHKKWYSWNQLSKFDKSRVYQRYGFNK